MKIQAKCNFNIDYVKQTKSEKKHSPKKHKQIMIKILRYLNKSNFYALD